MPSLPSPSSSATRCIPELIAQGEASHLPLTSSSFASYLDEHDVLSPVREEFDIPGTGEREIYFCAHALGAMPKRVPQLLAEEVESWRETGAPGHSHLKNPNGKPWTAGHPSGGVDERYTDVMADLVGALPEEVTWMGSLTSDLHHLLNAFYRPNRNGRYKILYEGNAFPSDRFAFHSQAQLAGLDPCDALIGLLPRQGEDTLRTSDILATIEEQGNTIALIIFGAVHWETGQWLDMETITRAGKEKGCVVGWDCAHAAGNVPMSLHDWGVDFAVWCTYKYLTSGPGSTAGVFVHEKHFDLPRQAGWWGHELSSRFVYAPGFKPRTGAAGFTVSNPSVFGTVPVHASMQVFDSIASLTGRPRKEVIGLVRAKSILLTGYLEYLLAIANSQTDNRISLHVLSPVDPIDRGSCLSFRVKDLSASDLQDQSRYSAALVEFCAKLEKNGVTVDKRAPDLVRLAPSALYNTFEEAWRLGAAIREALM
ncbi:kynureninase [Kwoniella shandongensis]|uniref:Kynureninase n=1 Tax=Kwoniella shandongensis TaxID=1734106 RepID=A0AAJ8LGP0_9TREE